ncbi:MAG: hypothetical protein ACI4PE_05950 [Bacilli bacterium]
MFYDERQAIEKCEEEPSQIFNLIDEGHLELVDKILRKRNTDINIVNKNEDDILSYLLKKNHYDLVLKHMKKKDWNVNHQNKDGDTFAHILVTKKYLEVIDIIKQIHKNKNFIPNIRNKNGETILDRSINNNYIYTTVKILEDERFNNIDLVSFKNLYEKYIKNDNYGVYSKMNNLEVIVDNLKDKELLPKLTKIINALTNNIEEIKQLVKNNDIKTLDNMIYGSLKENK